mmetsp:Transcript_72277/g.205525  ORF Transcript_72277/g.205525 Transcript_72277/m.205525 type:complete len:613 (-) Transcript_72277:129-1967(-)
MALCWGHFLTRAHICLHSYTRAPSMPIARSFLLVHGRSSGTLLEKCHFAPRPHQQPRHRTILDRTRSVPRPIAHPPPHAHTLMRRAVPPKLKLKLKMQSIVTARLPTVHELLHVRLGDFLAALPEAEGFFAGPNVEVLQGKAVLHVAQLRRGGLPVPPLGLLARVLAELLTERRVGQQLLHPRHVAGGVSRLDQVAGLAVVDQPHHAAAVAPDHGHAARHRLEHHEAEGLRVGGHHEHVGRGEGFAEVVALQLAGEDGLRAGEHAAQLLLLRAPADDGQPNVGALVHDRTDVRDPLLRAETTHIDHERVVRVAVGQRRAEVFTPELRAEADRVDALAPDLDPLHAVLLQLLLHLRARHQGQVRAVVHKAQQQPGRVLDAGDPAHVLLGVDREVSVVRHDERDLVAVGVHEAIEDQHARGAHVDELGLEALHRRVRAHLPVEAQTYLLVERELEALDRVDTEAELLLRSDLRLVRRHDLDLIARLAHVAEHLVEPVGVARHVGEGRRLDHEAHALRGLRVQRRRARRHARGGALDHGQGGHGEVVRADHGRRGRERRRPVELLVPRADGHRRAPVDDRGDERRRQKEAGAAAGRLVRDLHLGMTSGGASRSLV